MTSFMFEKIKNSNIRDNIVREHMRRKAIVACLKHGMCPDCGYDTRAIYKVAERTTLTYCVNKNCRFHLSAFVKTYGWLRLHNV